jgi:hypothetical protein
MRLFQMTNVPDSDTEVSFHRPASQRPRSALSAGLALRCYSHFFQRNSKYGPIAEQAMIAIATG